MLLLLFTLSETGTFCLEGVLPSVEFVGGVGVLGVVAGEGDSGAGVLGSSFTGGLDSLELLGFSFC